MKILLLLLFLANYCQCSRYKKVPGVAHYKLHYKPKSWWDAQSTCRREEGYLAEVRSIGAFQALERLLGEYPDENLHVHAGFSDQWSDGNLEWVTGGSVHITGGWNAPWEGKMPPLFNDDRTCGTFGGFTNPLGGGLSLAACEIPRPFICERNIHYRRHILYPFKKWLGKIFKK